MRNGCNLIARERLIAAKMGYPTVHAFMADRFGVTHPLAPSHMAGKMLEAVAVDLRSTERMSGRGRKPKGDSADQNDSNIKSRVWKPTLPVLHLALALHAEMNNASLIPNGDSVDALNLGDILLDEACPLRLLSYANELRSCVRCALNIEEKQQLQFIFTN